MEAIPIAVFWTITAWALFRQKHVLLYLFFGSLPFGSFAAIPTELTGGLTLAPTPIVAILLIARQLGSARGVAWALDAALKRVDLLLLLLFWIVAGIVTAFMPRFFAGAVVVVPVRLGVSADTVMLAPTVQNFSQFVYVSISVLIVFAFASLLQEAPMRRHALAALCLGSALTALTGVLDFASQYLPLQAALELFRTASYALLTDDEVLDVRRVVGLMPEASSFGSLTLAFLSSLYFFRRAMPAGGLRDRVVPVLMGLLLLLACMSTSSATYLGLAVLGVAAVADWCWRLMVSGRNPKLRRGLAAELWLAAAAACALLWIVITMPQVLVPVRDMVDVMVLQKSSSSSYADRTMSTQVSLQALRLTDGLGVGLGGTRASNFAVTLASNAGLLGAALYFLFVLQSLVLRGAPPGDTKGRALMSALRWSYLPPFFTSLVIGTTPDFGLYNAFLYGFAVALARRKPRHAAGPAGLPRAAEASRRAPQQRFAMERSAHAG